MTKNTKSNTSITADVASLIPDSIDVLGMDETGKTIIWDTEMRKLWRIGGLGSRKLPGMVQICGQEALFKAACDAEGNVDLEGVRMAIAQASRRRIFRAEDSLGQGIWPLKETDGVGGMVIVSGTEAVTVRPSPGGCPVIEAVNGPVIDDKLIEYGANAWIDLAQLTAAIMTVTEAQIKDAWLQLVEYLDAWNYAAPCDRDIVAAMVMATDIQAVLPFRPHMWLSGPTNCGKTALMTLLKGLWPYAVEAGNETTEAGVRQSVARNCLPLLLDEQEAWPGRRRIINLLRSATRGDLVIKGRPGGDPLKFSMRVIGWMAAIDVGLRSAADRNRFLVVELEPSDRIAVPTEAVLGDLNVTLVAAAVVLAPKIIAMWERLRVAAAHRHYGRLLEAVAVPVAIKAAALGLSDEQADALLADMLDQKGAALTEQFEDDHEQLLVSILSARIRARGRPAVSRKGCHQQTVDGLFCVGDLIQSDVGWRELDTVGIRKLKHDRIFFAPNPVQRHLLGGRRWAETNIGSVLLRIPDARRDRQRVAGTSTRGVSLPMSALPMEETGEKDEVFTEIPAAPTEVLTETPANRTGSAIEDAAGDTGLVVEETTEAIDVISEGPKDVLDIPDDSESDEIAEELEPDMRRQALGASTPQLPHTVQEGR